MRVGFTLTELLVALVVLVIMILGLAVAMSNVSTLWLSNIGSLDNFTKARVVLDLLDRDVRLVILRRDLPAFVDASGSFLDANNNPDPCFYTSVEGPSSSTTSRTLSLVQYSLTNPTTNPTLVRSSYGMNFTAAGTTPAVGTTGTLSLPSSGSQTDTLFTGIIAFQMQFINGSGAVITPTSGSGTLFSTYDFRYPGDPANPRMLVVSMLVLSNPAYVIANKNPATMVNILSCFSSTSAPLTSNNPLYSQAWNAALTNPSATFLALPLSVRRGIEVFERHIALPLTTPSL